MLKEISLAFLMTTLFLTSQATAQDFGCEIVGKNQENGTWNATFTNCLMEPKENSTIVENITVVQVINITNTTFNDTVLGSQLSEFRENFTAILNEKLDAEKRLVDLNTTFLLCQAEITRTQNFSAVEADLSTCNLESQLTSTTLRSVQAEKEELEEFNGYYLIGIVGSLAALGYTNRKKIFTGKQEYENPTGEKIYRGDSKRLHEKYEEESEIERLKRENAELKRRK